MDSVYERLAKILGEEMTKRLPSRVVDKLENEKVMLIGAGGVGTWFAILYSLTVGVPKLIIVDDDRLELVNANRLPYPFKWFAAKVPKAVALQQFIYSFRPNADIKTVLEKVTPENRGEIEELARSEGVTVIAEAVDNPQSTDLVFEIARELAVPVVSGHYDGFRGSVTWIPPEGEFAAWTLDENAGGYTVPSIAVMPAVVASLMVSLLIEKPDKLVHIQI